MLLAGWGTTDGSRALRPKFMPRCQGGLTQPALLKDGERIFTLMGSKLKKDRNRMKERKVQEEGEYEKRRRKVKKKKKKYNVGHFVFARFRQQ